MNAACPTCGYHWGANGPKNDTLPVPIEEGLDPELIGTLHFCSEDCRDEYKETEGKV